MRSILASFVGTGVIVGLIGCSSGSGSGADNQPKLAKPADPKLQPTAPSGAGAPKAASQ